MNRVQLNRLSLRHKAVGMSVAITMASLILVAATSLAQIKREVAAEQRRAADSVALGFARAAELAMSVRDSRELSRLGASFLRDDNVLFIAAYADKATPLAIAVRDHASWEQYLAGGISNEKCVVGQRPVEAIANDEFGEETSVDPTAATAQPKSRLLGRVVVGLSNTAATAAMHEQMRAMVLVTTGAAISGALLLYFSLGSWMRRLQCVADASGSISRGDFSGSINDKKDDEIGRLAYSFDAMRVALRERDHRLREFTETLQEQVKERTADLQGALSAAEDANRAKSMFLANMSHELRTPLNGVIGMVDLLLSANPNAQQARYCEVAKSSARSLLDLINDILDFSKIEAGKLELDSTDFNLHQEVESVISMLGNRAESKKLELLCRVGPTVPQMVNGDPVRIRQVLTNLVTNAIKFTEKGEVVVDVQLDGETESDAVVRFKVRDSGIGIPKDRIGRLFQSFSQVDASTTRRFGGTGLGLAISQRIVEMMSGTIGVESEEGQGSCFWFYVRLPKRPNQQVARRENRVDPRGLRALAVDDNHTNREILQAQLASWALRPDVADNASRALDMLKDAKRSGDAYRFAILDMHMPHVDGVELAQRIKSDPDTRDVILISLSSISDQLQPNAMSRLGFSACLTKPALPSQLYNAIVDCLAATETNAAGASPEPLNLGVTGSILLPGVRVLLAEDNDVNRLVASELLQQAGCEVSMAVNGREAVAAVLGENRFDVVLMDCQMPEMDGFEATKTIRQAEAADASRKHSAIIALTANAIKGDREACLASGMDGYVTKPIEPAELFQTIRLFLSPERRAEITNDAATKASRATPMPAAPPAAPSSVAPAPASNAAAAPIDLESLKARCMGNRKIAAKALSKFDVSMAQDVQALTEGVQKRDAKAIAASAHKLKGAAANVSAGSLRLIAAELEKLGRADELAQTEAALEQLNKEVQRFRGFLDQALKDLTPGAGAAAPATPTR